MAEKVNIASLTIDFDDVIKKSGQLKGQIEALKKTQKQLDLTTVEGQRAFAELDVSIKNVSKSYRDNQSFARALESANEDLDKTLSTQNKSTQELRDSRSQLNQISKNIKGDTEEEIILRNQLNAAIDEQTEALREQSSEFNTSKDSIGEYEKGILAAAGKLNIFNGGIGGFVERSSEAGGTGKLFTGSLSEMGKGLLGVTKASLAFIATPIGAVIAALALGFALVQNAMNRSEDATNSIKKAFAAFSGIIKGVLKLLEPLGEFLIDGIVKGFELAEKAIFSAAENVAKALEFLGFDEQAESLRGFTNEIKESAEASKALVQAEIELEKAQRIAQKTQLDFQKAAEKLRQIRDDETKSMPERIKANEELGAVLKEQLASELAIAQKALEVANLRIFAEGQTKEALDEQAEALTSIADIQERITGQESEQLVNRVSLQKEAAEKFKEIQQKAIEQQKEQLDLFIAQQGQRAKTLQEQLELERSISEKSKEILDAELKAKLISREKYDTEILNIQNDLLARQAELAVDNARRELQDYIQKNESKLESDKFFTEEALAEELRRNNLIAEQKKAFEEKRLEEGVISQTEYNDAINEVNEENRLLNEELELERKEAKLEQDAIDFENRLALDAERNQSEFDILTNQLEADRLAEVKAAEKSGANIALINEKFAAKQKTIDKALRESKLQGYAAIADGFASFTGEQTAVGKAAGVAQATINTYQGASLALATYPQPVGGILAGVTIAQGLLQVGKILGISDKFEKGGILQGARHSQGGIKTPFGELEGGEAVINRRSTAMFAPMLSEINAAGGGKRFASGGILGSTSTRPQTLIDSDSLAESIAEANKQLPSPIVSIEEIKTVDSNVTVVENNASF